MAAPSYVGRTLRFDWGGESLWGARAPKVKAASGTQSGDLLVMVTTKCAIPTVTGGTGTWVKQVEGGTAPTCWSVWTRTAGDNEPNTDNTVSFTRPEADKHVPMGIVLYTVRGGVWDSVISSLDTFSSPTLPAGTGKADALLLLTLQGLPVASSLDQWTPPAGVTEVLDSHHIAAGHQTVAAAGSVGPWAWVHAGSATAIGPVAQITPPAPEAPPPAAPAHSAPSTAVPINPGESIQAKVDAATTGTVFLLKAGVHAEQQVTPKDDMTFWGETGTIMSGARMLTGWVAANGRWHVDGQTQKGQSYTSHLLFHDGWEATQYPEDLWFGDGATPKRRVMSLAEVGAGKWFFDYTNSRIYVGDDPAGQTVRTSVAQAAFSGPAKNVKLRNLKIERYAATPQGACIGGFGGQRAGVHWDLQGVEVTMSHAWGALIGPGWTVRNCYFHHNGQGGIGGRGTLWSYMTPSNYTAPVLVEDCEISYNRTVDGYKWGHEGGGTKFSVQSDMTFRRNWVHHNRGPGAWFDVANKKILCEKNLVDFNDARGIFYELGNGGHIRHNVVRSNSQVPYASGMNHAAIDISEASDCLVENNLVYDSPIGIWLRRDGSRTGSTTERNTVRNNDVHATAQWAAALHAGNVTQAERDRLANSAGNNYSGNTWRLPQGTSSVMFSWGPNYSGKTNFSGWKWKDSGGENCVTYDAATAPRDITTHGFSKQLYGLAWALGTSDPMPPPTDPETPPDPSIPVLVDNPSGAAQVTPTPSPTEPSGPIVTQPSIAVVATDTTTASDGRYARGLSFPGVTVGDLLVCVVNGSYNPTDRIPSGWSHMVEQGNTIMWRWVTASEPTSYTFVGTADRGNFDVFTAVALRGVSTAHTPVAILSNAKSYSGNYAPTLQIPAAGSEDKYHLTRVNITGHSGKSEAVSDVTADQTAWRTLNTGLAYSDWGGWGNYGLMLGLWGAGPAQTIRHRSSSGNGNHVYFVLQLTAANHPPNAPKLLAPSSLPVATAKPITFTADFSDPNEGDQMSAYEIEYRPVGATSWQTTGQQATSGQKIGHTLAGGTLTVGQWEWRARTKDAAGVQGPWSGIQQFTVATTPTKTVIVTPQANTAVPAAMVLEWTATAQDAIQVQIVLPEDDRKVVFDTGELAFTGRKGQVPRPVNDRAEIVRIRVKFGGLWSDWAEVPYSVSFTGPAAPTWTETLTPEGAVAVHVTHATPVAPQPVVSSISIDRQQSIDGGATWTDHNGKTDSFDRIAVDETATALVDWLVSDRTLYRYRIVTRGVNGAVTTTHWS